MSSVESILRNTHSLIGEGKEGGSGLVIRKLAGDASLRRYYRVQEGDASYVLMLTEPFDPESFDFLLVRAHLEKCGLPVPKLCALDGERGAILLEDLGDRTMLHELCEQNGDGAEMALFRDSLKLLADFHRLTKAPAGVEPVPGYGLAFDEEKLMWEMDFTLEHLFGSYLKRKIPEKEHSCIREAFVDICRRLAAEPRVFTHRDFHSRNIMIPAKGGMVCIDFQDARMGPCAYDLASILRDSYYQLSEEKVYELVDFYLGQYKGEETGSESHFLRIFDLMSVQRNFKAIGSFTSFYGKRSDAMYIRFVGNTFENIRRNLAKFPEYRELRKLLFLYYYF